MLERYLCANSALTTARNERYVAIKVVFARRSEAGNLELHILRRFADDGDPDHPGYKHISRLLDSFYHEGPNGRHLCIVTELLGPAVSCVADRSLDCRLDGSLARQVSQQLLHATRYLHSCGIAHGGRHM